MLQYITFKTKLPQLFYTILPVAYKDPFIIIRVLFPVLGN